jgi:hypothetical protein
MKRLAVVLFACAVWLSLSALAQDTSSSSPQQGSSGSSAESGGMGQSSTSSQGTTSSTGSAAGAAAGADTSGKAAGKAKLKHLKGTIGQDGKTFTTEKDSKSWTIMNPEAVQGHEGHHVRLSAHVYPDKDSIHVMSVKMAGEKGEKSSGKKSSSDTGAAPPQ